MLYKKAFTLAEIMIVLVVIGILTAILLPAGLQSAPNENIMKFKKANTTLYRVINELVSSDKYYKDGDLGIKPNGDLIDGSHDGDYTYFCSTIADILSTKSVNCSKYSNINTLYAAYSADEKTRQERSWIMDLQTFKNSLDSKCKKALTIASEEIVTTDNVIYFEGSSEYTFGINDYEAKHLLGNTYCEDANNVEGCKKSRHTTASKINSGERIINKLLKLRLGFFMKCCKFLKHVVIFCAVILKAY